MSAATVSLRAVRAGIGGDDFCDGCASKRVDPIRCVVVLRERDDLGVLWEVVLVAPDDPHLAPTFESGGVAANPDLGGSALLFLALTSVLVAIPQDDVDVVAANT